MKTLKRFTPSEKRKLRKALVYEKSRGKTIYYRNYKKVLSGELNVEAVMGASKLQWLLIGIVLRFLFGRLDRRKYEVATNEAGFLFAKGSWRNLDIAIFDREKILEEGIDNRYVKIAPEIVIEVDTKAEVSEVGGFEIYMREKTEDLLLAGVKKVIWFTTLDKRVLVAELDKDWILSTWDKEIPLLEDITLNSGKLIKEDGLEL